jgi:CysZ protein
MFSALAAAFGDLGDPRIRGVLWKSLGLALLVLALLATGLWFLVAWLAHFQIGWLDKVIEFAAGFGVVILAWFLFPAAVTSTLGVFLDEVSEAVERRHYPYLPKARPQSWGEIIRQTLAFAAIAVGLNLLLLPFYLLLLWFPPAYAALFYGVNGYLLGREYFEQVAMRRLDPEAARRLRRTHQGRIVLAGVAIAFLLTVPFLNLIAPVVATAFMLHLTMTLTGSANRRR